jgi:hypothetical protein
LQEGFNRMPCGLTFAESASEVSGADFFVPGLTCVVGAGERNWHYPMGCCRLRRLTPHDPLEMPGLAPFSPAVCELANLCLSSA